MASLTQSIEFSSGTTFGAHSGQSLVQINYNHTRHNVNKINKTRRLELDGQCQTLYASARWALGHASTLTKNLIGSSLPQKALMRSVEKIHQSIPEILWKQILKIIFFTYLVML